MTLTREEAIALNEANRDIIENEKPLGLMTEDQQARMKEWDYGWEVFISSGWGAKPSNVFGMSSTFRAKPAPVPVERIVRWVNVYTDCMWTGFSSAQNALHWASSDDYLTTFRIEYNADGTDPQIFVEDGE